MTWNDIRHEMLNAPKIGDVPGIDRVRRAKIRSAEELTGIPLIVYAVDFTAVERAANYGAGLQIDLNDKTGFQQATSDIEDGPLDVLIHSPGGSPSATESIVAQLRSRFGPIRFIVPHTAKSAATMLALSGDEILLADIAELGPIDPQLRIVHDQRPVSVPAGAAIAQFKRMHNEVTAQPSSLFGWLPLVRMFGPSFLQECENAVSLSEELATRWLKSYMFKGDPDAEKRAKGIAAWLSDHGNFNSHARPIRLDEIRRVEPKIKARSLSEVGADFERAIMDVYWALDVTFDSTAAFKLIEHTSEQAAFIRLQQRQQLVGPFVAAQPQEQAPARQKRTNSSPKQQRRRPRR